MFVIRKDNKVILADNDRKRLETTLKYKPDLQSLKIEETDKEYFIYNGEYVCEVPLDELKQAKRAEINQARDAAEQGGFEYMGKIFDSDPISCQRISCAAQAMSLVQVEEGQPEPTITWTCQDNSTIDLNPVELLGLVAALAQWSNSCHEKATALKAQIDAATTNAEVEAVKWN